MRYVTLNLLGYYMARIIAGTVTSDVGQSAATWAVAITADDANDALAVTVTGAAGVSVRWHAVVQGSEVVY